MYFYDNLDDLLSKQHKIPFNVIGTDSTLFHESVDGLADLTLGVAERVDLLVNFAAHLPKGI